MEDNDWTASDRNLLTLTLRKLREAHGSSYNQADWNILTNLIAKALSHLETEQDLRTLRKLKYSSSVPEMVAKDVVNRWHVLTTGLEGLKELIAAAVRDATHISS
jgi:hypothetical protein